MFEMDRREDRRQAEDRVRKHAAPTRRVTVATGCWLFVLVAIGVVQIVRTQWFDALVYAVAAVGVVLVAIGLSPRPPGWHIALPWLAGSAGVVAAILCFLPRHSLAMQAAVIGIGGAAIVLAWSAAAVARPGTPTRLTRGILRLALAWALIVVTGCVWELIQFILGLVEPDSRWFALSDLLNPAVDSVPGRVVFIAAWIAGGAWLLRRGGTR
jgi:hypothetical protein